MNVRDKQSAALHWAPACAGATDIRFCKSLRPSEKFSDGLYIPIEKSCFTQSQTIITPHKHTHK